MLGGLDLRYVSKVHSFKSCRTPARSAGRTEACTLGAFVMVLSSLYKLGRIWRVGAQGEEPSCQMQRLSWDASSALRPCNTSHPLGRRVKKRRSGNYCDICCIERFRRRWILEANLQLDDFLEKMS